MENKRSGVLMGTISLFPAPELKTGWHLNTEILGSAWEAGYALGRKWWNNGYMTEALCAVRDYWFNTVDAPCWRPSMPTRMWPAAPCCKKPVSFTTTM